MIKLGHRYRVSTPHGGSIEVWLDPHVLETYGTTPEKLKEEVIHAAWCELWKGDAKRMLKSLCDKLGVDKVKAEFTKKSSIQEIE